jgi:hypothetical protein
VNEFNGNLDGTGKRFAIVVTRFNSLITEQLVTGATDCLIRHGVVEGAFSWVRDLEVIAPYVDTLVAKDFAWAPRDEGLRVLNVPFGEGLVPVDEFVEQLRRLGVSAPFSMHFEYPHPETGRRDWAVESFGRDRAALRAALASGTGGNG